MTIEELYSWVNDPETLDESAVQKLGKVVESYPYFQTSRLLYTKSLELTDHEQFGEELPKTAVLCSDRIQLLYLIRHKRYARFLAGDTDPNKQNADRTEALLNSFLSTLSDKEETKSSLPDPTQQIVSTDYFAYLESLGEENDQEGEAQPFQHQDIIDAFIEKAETDELFSPATTPSSPARKVEEKEEGGEFLTETLARIYIKQHKYEQALTIIQRLSLNFPKKSAYFADQIRFLEYLITNAKNKKNE